MTRNRLIALLGLWLVDFIPFSSAGICELCVCTQSDGSKIINCYKNREMTNYTEIFDLLAFDEVDVIKKVMINNHEISSLPLDAFRRLKSLESLDISRNLIEDLEADIFKDLANLRQLDFSQNQLKTLSGSVFKNLPNLLSLNLSRNSIDDLSETKPDALGKLTSLDLSHNEIKNIDNEFIKSLVGLKFLDVSYNRIESIPSDTILRLKSLTELRISNNLLTILASENFPESLTNLNVAGNLIESLPQNLWQIRNLNVANNKINSIETDESWIKKLRHLNVSGNSLTSFPKVIFDELNSLDLSRNKFTMIPINLNCQTLPKLEILLIDANPITDLSFNENLQLRKLYARNFEQLEIIEANSFAKLEGIDDECVDLIVSGNPRLNRIKEGAFDNVSICTLDLSENALTKISPEVIKWNGKFVANRGIDFQGNPFNCECELQWMLNDFVPYIYESNPKLLESLRCERPSELSGTRMVHWYKWTRQVFCDTSSSRMGKMVLDPSAVISSGEKTIRFESSGGMLAVVAGALATLCILVIVGIVFARKFELRRRRTNRRF